MSNRMISTDDFVGFTYNGVHSSELGIVRTVQGLEDRNLLPEKKDITSEVPGSDGTYYWGSTHGKRTIPINFAFDGLTEQDLKRLKQLLNDKKLHELTLDEEPYKTYMVKPSNIATIKHICFDVDGQRLYKGTGSVEFISFSPFSQSKYPYLQDYFIAGYDNLYQWNKASGIPTLDYENLVGYGGVLSYQEGHSLKPPEIEILEDSKNALSGFIEFMDFQGIAQQEIKIVNCGDVPMPITLTIELPEGTLSSDYALNIKLEKDGQDGLVAGLTMQISKKLNDADKYLVIDCANYQIYSLDSNKKRQNTLYNLYITNGDFFEIPVGAYKVSFDDTQGIAEYHYLYL